THSVAWPKGQGLSFRAYAIDLWSRYAMKLRFRAYAIDLWSRYANAYRSRANPSKF
ncbi:MAG: hypothetical protein F6K53_41440, partial [Moorea sp. SIO4A1]|nr:hypothetical protein [Moorena sp. SIO4A1]